MLSINKSKKGQLAIFIIVGVLIFLSFILLFFSNGSEISKDLDVDSASLSSLDVSLVKELVESCADYNLAEGMELFGKDDLMKLENYIDDGVRDCVTLGLDNYGGVDFDLGIASSNLEFSKNNEDMILDMNYPVSFYSSGKSVSIENYKLIIPLTSQIKLDYDSNGLVKKDYLLISPDSKYRLKVKKGTSAKINNNNVDKIDLKIKDKETYKSPYVDIIGSVVYELSPSGAVFNPPLELTYYYKQNDISDSINERNLKVAFYDSITGSSSEKIPFGPGFVNVGGVDRNWISYDGGFIDIDNNIVQVGVGHFSTHALIASDVTSSTPTADIADLITPPNTCANGQRLVMTETSWCMTDCNTGSACGGVAMNCDCYSGCNGGRDLCGANISLANITCNKVDDISGIGASFSVTDFGNDTLVVGNDVVANLGDGSFTEIPISGDACRVSEVYNDYIYVITSNTGTIYRSINTVNWESVYKSDDNNYNYNYGCGLAIAFGQMYGSVSDSNAKKSKIVKTNNGFEFEDAFEINISINNMISYNSSVYVLGEDINNNQVLLRFDESENITERTIVDDKFIDLLPFAGDLLAMTYSSGIASVVDVIEQVNDSNLTNSVEVDTQINSSATTIVDWKGYFFAGNGPILEYSEERDSDWDLACNVSGEIKELIVHDDQLYFMTTYDDNNYDIYDVEITNKYEFTGDLSLADMYIEKFLGSSGGDGGVTGTGSVDTSATNPAPAGAESLNYHGRHNGDRPTWYGNKKMSEYPDSFEVVVEGCGAFTVTGNNGHRFEAGSYIAKQSDVAGRGLAIIAPASCGSTSAYITNTLSGAPVTIPDTPDTPDSIPDSPDSYN